nr:RHS repeat-associated core domain-containing protein [Delftia acidovorans]
MPLGSFPGTVGNPVQVATGNKVEYEKDFQDQRPASLDVVRVYNSAWANGLAEHPPVSYGKGWSNNHVIWLKFERNNIDPLKGDRTKALKKGDHESVIIASAAGDQAIFYRFIPGSNLPESSGSYTPGEFVSAMKGRQFFRIENGWMYINEREVKYQFDNNGRLSKKTLPNGDYYEYIFSDRGQLLKIGNNFSRSIVFEYDAAGLVSRMIPSHGDSIQFKAEAGLLASVKYNDGSVKGYLYEDSGMLAGKIDETGARVGEYIFNEKKVVVSRKAPGVEEFRFSYRSVDTAVTSPLGETIWVRNTSLPGGRIYSSTSTSKITVYQDEPVSSVSYDYDGFLKDYYGYNGYQTAYQWDKKRNLPIEISQNNGEKVTRISWHPVLRKPIKITGDGLVRDMDYDSRGNLTRSVASGAGASRALDWSWDDKGNLRYFKDSGSLVASYAYDDKDNRLTETNALGHITRFSNYDGLGRILSLVEPNGSEYQLTYDARGRIASVASSGLNTRYKYLDNGLLQAVEYSNGYVLRYQYDAVQRLTGWFDNRGAFGSYVLDGMGNTIQEKIGTQASGVAYEMSRTINAMNRVASITMGDSQKTSFSYDESGDLKSIVDGFGKSLSIIRDRFRRIYAIQNDRSSMYFAYTPSDLVSQVKDFRQVATDYGRDGLGNMTQEKSPDIGANSLTYDQRGLIATAKDAAGRTLAVQRDALGRPTQLQYGSTATSTLRYDLPGTTYNGPGAPKASTGYLSEIQDPGVTTQYQRDILGRVLRKSQILTNGDTRSLIHSYVPAGQGGGGELQSITYPSGKQATYLYDSTGQITGLQWNGQPLVTGLAWSPLGQPTAWQWTGFVQQPGATAGLAEQRSYNTAGQLASSTLLNLTWDAAGRISLIQQQHMLPGTAAAQQAKLSSAFSYDAVGRLTASAHSAPSGLTLPTGWSLADTIELSASGYAWDANGNRTQVHYSNALASGTSTLQRNYQTAAGTNRLQSYAQTLQRPGSVAQNSNVTFSYDAAGALVKKGDNHLHYGADGRIAKAGEYADAADARAVSYVYNALGQRVLKSDARSAGQPATLQTLYAEDGIGSTVLGQYANQRSANSAAPAGQSDSTEIIYLPTASGPMPIAAEINGRLYAIHTDHLNTPRRLTNQQGQVAWQWLISGFGEVRPTTGDRGYGQTVSGPSYVQAVKFDLRYPGQVFDEETGLSYNLHRYYDAATGRYMQADPIGLEGGWNRFGYVGGNPLNFIDPKGLEAQICTYPGFNNDWPHVFTCVNGNCAGWYPSGYSGAKPKGPWAAMMNSNGAYVDDSDIVDKSYCGKVAGCDEKYIDQCVLDCRSGGNKPSKYNLFNENCMSTAQQCVQKCVVNSCKAKIWNFLR